MAGKIYRVKHEKNFVVLDKTVLQDSALSWKAKGVHCYLMQLPDNWDINLQDLRNRSSDKRDSTAAGMKELLKAGYVRRIRVVDEKTKTFVGYDYHVYEQPAENGFSVDGFPENGFSENGKPTTSKNYKNQELKKPRTNKARNSQTANAPDSEICRGAAAGYTFDQFWNDYGHKVGSKAKAEKAFAKLSEIDRGAIRDTLEAYKRATVTTDAGRAAGVTFKPLRQHPLTYLNGRVWETYTDSMAQAEQPTEYDEAYQKYVAWVEQNYPQAKRTCTNLSKTQFIEFKKTSVANIIGKESELKFLKTAHESAGEKDAWTIYQKLVNDRMEARRI